MIKPKSLKRGDTAAIVSLSSGMAGEYAFLPRFQRGVKRIEEEFGLKTRIMPHALKGIDFLYHHPEARAPGSNGSLPGSGCAGGYLRYRR